MYTVDLRQVCLRQNVVPRAYEIAVGVAVRRHHTGHLGRPAIVTSHNGRYLVLTVQHTVVVIGLSPPLAYCAIFSEMSADVVYLLYLFDEPTQFTGRVDLFHLFATV